MIIFINSIKGFNGIKEEFIVIKNELKEIKD